MAKNHYGEVTNRIVAQLEAGTPPWIKEWKSIGRRNIPKNAVTKRPYSGGNVIFLWAHGYATQRWLTFKQALDVGGVVRKRGTRGKGVFRFQGREDDRHGRSAPCPVSQRYTVFNVAQCHGLPEECLTGEVTTLNLDERNADAQDFITVTGADFREGQGEPYYAAGRDFISMPSFEAFKDADCFYATSFHELGHWSGHKSRLDRDLTNRFGNRAYAAEELVAELASAFLCAEFGINKEVRHASYIANWIELLRADDRAFFTAASQAQKAADYLRGLALTESLVDTVA